MLFCLIIEWACLVLTTHPCLLPLFSKRRYRSAPFGRRLIVKDVKPRGSSVRFQPKPAWVIEDLIRLRAHFPSLSLAKLAHTFNRIHAQKESVSKSYVYKIVLLHRHSIEARRQEFRTRKPVKIPINAEWGLDLTGKGDAYGNTHNILGIIDHGSRLAISMRQIAHANTWTLLGHLFIASASAASRAQSAPTTPRNSHPVCSIRRSPSSAFAISARPWAAPG
jgi:hypothetical protein